MIVFELLGFLTMKRWFFLFLLSALWNHIALAELKQTRLDIISDSEEPFNRRVYSYDFDVSEKGTIHYVYSKPVPGEERAQIIYTSKQIGGDWPTENKRFVLEEFGLRPSISTHVIYDDAKDTVHISYIVHKDFIDNDNVKHSEGLVYQKITGGQVGPQMNVSPGGYHTAMQLNENGEALFLREYEIFLTSSGSLLKAPFPEALRILRPISETRWTDREHILKLPEEVDYRLANFYYDKSNGRYHILYGNKDADYLRATYPTTNPPVDASKTPVYFPPGSGHELIYAYSDDMKNWKTSFVDQSGDLSENEFWTDLEIDNQGNPFVANYRYKTDAKGIQQGSTGRFSRLINGVWNSQTISGLTTGATEPRAGMGAKIIQDENGGFHGFWDNSPDAPIDSVSPHGTTLYRYSPDGINWQSRQMALPFSAEGRCRAKIVGNKLLLTLLADFQDARLLFVEYELPGTKDNLFEVSTDKMFYGAGEKLGINARLQGDKSEKADLYFVVVGPFDKDENDNFITIPTTSNYYLDANFSWQQVSDVFDAKPVVSNLPLSNFIGPVFQVFSKNTDSPFKLPSRYRLFSGAVKPGSLLRNLDLITPIYADEIHVCNKPNCKELIGE